MSNQSNGGGIGFVEMLTILFIGLKLAGVINWSWLWVLSPVLFVAFCFIVLVAYGVSSSKN